MTLNWRHDGDYWEPEGGERRPWKDLVAGDLFALRRQVWRVHAVRPVPIADWEDCDRQNYKSCARRGVSEEDWDDRPLYLTISPAKGGRRRDIRGRPYATFYGAWVLHPHYPVCADCGEPWPCPELDINREVREQSAEVERLSAILPGCCWGCGEPVTHRQMSARFDGENLLMPGAPSPVFHLRAKRECSGEALKYEERWVAADPGRKWRFQCPAQMTRHLDGNECAAGPDCPGAKVMHHNATRHLFREIRGDGPVTYIPVNGTAGECPRCMDAAGRRDLLGQAPPGAML